MTIFRTFHIAAPAVLAVAVGLTAAATAAPAAAATTYTVTDLGSLGLGVSDGSAINATGEVTGTSYLSTLVPTPFCPPVYGNTKKTCVEHPWHAFLCSNGQMTDPGTVGGGDFSAGSAISPSGQVADGWAANNGGSDAFVWNGKKMIDLGQQAPLNGSDSGANGINDSGQVVGTYGTSDPQPAFLYSNGTITSLGSFTAAAINDSGVMVGGPSVDSGGTVQNLDSLIPAGSPYQIQDATAINNNGQIVANATYTPTRQTHALLLTPA